MQQGDLAQIKRRFYADFAQNAMWNLTGIKAESKWNAREILAES